MPGSLPALASGILQSHRAWIVRSAAAAFERVPLVPAYQIDEDLDPDVQAARVAQAVGELAHKLGRLAEAYGRWSVFDPGAYFDLYVGHMPLFCRYEETRATVRVRLYCDLLLPTFRRAERYWVETFLPAYGAGSGEGEQAEGAFGAYLVDEAIPELAARLDAAERGVQKVLDHLSGSVEVLNYLGGLEERIQHRPIPSAGIAPGLPRSLQRLPRQMPTLTLDLMFSRPEESTLVLDSRRLTLGSQPQGLAY